MRDELTHSTMEAVRKCLRTPIPEIEAAAAQLGEAVEAHRAGNFHKASQLILGTDTVVIREWVESLWGKKSNYVQYRQVQNSPEILNKAMRIKIRMPSISEQGILLARDGYRCRFCENPVIRAKIRQMLHTHYPEALPWGSTNKSQHSAFQAMWAQFDHVLPHARGGDNDFSNVVVTCAPCNFGRMAYTLEEVGLSDPRDRKPILSGWRGLEELFDKV